MTTSSLLLSHYLTNKDRTASMVSFWRSFAELSNGHGFCYVFLIGCFWIFKKHFVPFFFCYRYLGYAWLRRNIWNVISMLLKMVIFYFRSYPDEDRKDIRSKYIGRIIHVKGTLGTFGTLGYVRVLLGTLGIKISIDRYF